MSFCRKLFRFPVLAVLAFFFQQAVFAQTGTVGYRELTVANGLPQSFISGVVQDRQGFIWTGTRDGLARYDGKKFKLFKSALNDSTALQSNVITGLSLDTGNQLWITYGDGNMDVLNTHSGKVFQLTKHPVYRKLFFNVRGGSSVVQDAAGNYWILGNKGGLYVLNLREQQVDYYTEKDLDLAGSFITGISRSGNMMLLVNETAAVYLSLSRKLVKKIPLTPNNPIRTVPMDVNSPPVQRKNGDLIFFTTNRLAIYTHKTKSITHIPLPVVPRYWPPEWASDKQGNIFFDHNSCIYLLTPQNKLKIWSKLPAQNQLAMKVMIDRSGVFWRGTNGYGLQLIDLRLPRMPQLPYSDNFAADVFHKELKISSPWINKYFSQPSNSYTLRCTADKNKGIWFTTAGMDPVDGFQSGYYKQGRFITHNWTFSTSQPNYQVNQFAFSASGKLWGIDYHLRPLLLDTVNHIIYPRQRIPARNIDLNHDVGGLIIDGEHTWWVATTLGLFKHDLLSKQTAHYTAPQLPGNALTTMINDPKDSTYLWIGTLGKGLIKFNKRTKKSKVYTSADGLPNNTVYTIIASDDETLWCSTNKGIFSLNTRTHAVSSFSMLDGLGIDEFNRFHFLKLPGGKIAFGGTGGYTVFDPRAVRIDTYQPRSFLTGISINNMPADYGAEGSMLKQAINSLPEITLPYNQNSLVLSFAADEYNIPEKLHYRYQLEGFDERWVEAGSENSLTYTNIPPGTYTLKVNATNTAGIWSPHVKTLDVIITPPWWKTWWFITGLTLAAGTAIYLLARQRIINIKRKEREKLRVERDIIKLEAQALRAQMNPHFIFNCLNSIKALMQEEDRQAAIDYLTTFAQLIRIQLNNSQREISLFEELQTCKLYVQLESLRFANKLSCKFDIDESAQLHDIFVPPLILQPFIENAIWHGILPLPDRGDILIKVIHKGAHIECTVDDNGIGREEALKNRARHSPKGLQLVEDRINLHNQIHTDAASVEVVDKKDQYNRARGTLVILRLKLEHD